MMRWFDAALVALAVLIAGVTFWVKHDARRLADEIATLERRIEVERAAIELQEADWSLLSQPERLQELIEAHEEQLRLREPGAGQFVRLDRLGGELDALAPASIEDAIAELSTGGGEPNDAPPIDTPIDPTATGSIR